MGNRQHANYRTTLKLGTYLALLTLGVFLWGCGSNTSLTESVQSAINDGDVGLSLILVMLAGLLTALTPCVYPLIPITLGIFGAKDTTPARGFLLASTYVGGMALLYTVLGTAFAAMGAVAGSSLQNGWITLGVALFCFVMAASMFGAFEMALPTSVQTRFSQMGGAGFKGAFVMGLVAGIIAAPCTGPVLSFILVLIGQKGDLIYGASLMFFYALGIGIPFLILGTFSSGVMKLPKSGPWMEGVKSIFGIGMLVAGVYYMSFAVDSLGDVFKALGHINASFAIGAVLILSGLVVGALHLSFKYTDITTKIRKGVGVFNMTLGILILVSTLKTSNHQDWTTLDEKSASMESFNAILEQAKAEGKPVMVDFYADWCVACGELDTLTYADTRVKEELKRFTPIKIDATKESGGLEALQKHYRVLGLPTVLFFDAQGQLKEDKKITGFVDADTMLTLLKTF